jgi:hypothetical protein
VTFFIGRCRSMRTLNLKDRRDAWRIQRSYLRALTPNRRKKTWPWPVSVHRRRVDGWAEALAPCHRDFDSSTESFFRLSAPYFGARFLGCEHPFYAGARSIALPLPGSDFGYEAFLTVDATIQALTAPHANFDFHHVQPAGVLGNIVELQRRHVRSTPDTGSGYRRSAFSTTRRLRIRSVTSFAAGFANSAVSTDRISRSPTAGPTSKHQRDPLPKLMAHCRANASPVACAQDWQGRRPSS